ACRRCGGRSGPPLFTLLAHGDVRTAAATAPRRSIALQGNNAMLTKGSPAVTPVGIQEPLWERPQPRFLVRRGEEKNRGCSRSYRGSWIRITARGRRRR